MTQGRKNHKQRNKNKILKAINRISQINIMKMLKNLLGDGRHLPVSDIQNIENQEEPKDIEQNVNQSEKHEQSPEIAKNTDKANSNIINSEDLIITPYGTFSKYKQLELLDQYENTYQESSKPKMEVIEQLCFDNIEKEKKSDLTLETITNEAILIQKNNHEALVLADNQPEIVNAKILLSRFNNKVFIYAALVFTSIVKCFKLLGNLLLKIGIGFFSIAETVILKIFKFLYKLVPIKLKNRNYANNPFAIVLVRFIDYLDIKFGFVEERLVGFENKVHSIINKIWNVRLIIHIFFKAIYNKLVNAYNQSINYSFRNPRKVLSVSSAIFISIVTASLLVGTITAYEYSYNGKVLGIVKNQNDVYITVDVIGDKLAKEYEANIVIDKEKNLSFNKVIGFNLKIDTREDVLNSFTYLKDMEVQAFAIMVNGKKVAIVENKETAGALLMSIQNKYLKQSDKIKYDKVGFAEKVEIVEMDTKLGNLQEKDKIIDYILTGALEKKIHEVKSGETFSGIASSYGVKQAQLIASNPGIIPEKLKIGQKIVLTAAVPLLTVQTLETAEYLVPIPFSIEYENTEAKYKGEQSVKVRGLNGQKQVVAKIIRNNGTEISRTEISAVIISEPKSQVVLVGTKNPPPLIGTGTFISPIRGTITSRFGYRWGRLHTGVDIGVPTGTPVKASDGGTVIFSGRDGSLGICIRIDHGGNRVTTYGHLSKSFVKTGQKVFQGKQIGNSGNTGRSTGPHLHFEVKINGVFKNPLNYI